MTSVRNSKLFGTKADYYGDIIISGVSEAESKIADYCPLSYLDSASMNHTTRYDWDSNNYGFDENYSILTIPQGQGMHHVANDQIVSDKNFVINKNYIVNLTTGQIISNPIEDIKGVEILLDNGLVVCSKVIGSTQYWKLFDSFTGEEQTNPTGLTSNSNSISNRAYFKYDGKEYALMSIYATAQAEQLHGLSDNTNRSVWYYSSGTGTRVGYYQDKVVVKREYYSSGIPYLTYIAHNLFKNYNQNIFGGPKTQNINWIGIDSDGYCYLWYETDQKIKRVDLNSTSTYIPPSDWMSGVTSCYGVNNFGNLCANVNGDLYDLSEGWSGLLIEDWVLVSGALDYKNNWFWSISGNDLVALDINGTEQYRIEDVSFPVASSVEVYFHKNKFIITYVSYIDPYLYEYYYTTKIIHWDYENTE